MRQTQCHAHAATMQPVRVLCAKGRQPETDDVSVCLQPALQTR